MSDAFEVTRGIQNGSIKAKDMVTIVHTANKFTSSIVLHTPGKTVDVKSFLGLSVSLLQGFDYKLEIHGDDEDEAKKEMSEVFSKYDIKVFLA